MSDANAKCFKCKDAVCTEDQLTCQNCKNPFHFMCVGQAESSFRKMSKDRKAGWKCIDCKDVKEKEQNKDKDNRNDQNKEKSKKESKNQERDAFNIEMKTMEENGNKLMDYLNSKFQSLENSIKDQKDDVIKALNLKVKELEEKLEERDQKIADLEDRMDFIENRSRISNVEIRNMPETKNEDVQFLVESIGHTLGISVKEGDIQIAHRVQNRDGSNKNRPIIAHLGSRYIRNKWLKQYKDYKRSGNLVANKINPNLPNSNIYIYEHVTIKTKLLLNEVRAYAKENGIKFVWVKDGMILIKRSESDRHVTKISTKREFETYKIHKNRNFQNV
ncbi:uncharacterized protein LOC108252575 isoform X1 [Diaphorina citri]|uniref:Uncharacterized protein LOC108252575 isoform X1 n=1 Tax=Diaphorina citri TaxID=121845 RepID=A0A1S4EDH8_DIACI|nr:uncharacterized protein LOC108252575 isoform X2 [Diaphorina citri]XP_026680438.1 uncharacterized protein LOC108252575 isoform X1 [Diaphorina citri]